MRISATKRFALISAVFLAAAQADEDNSSAYMYPVPDGVHILVKKGEVYGGFVLFDQKPKDGDVKEMTKFRWWFREDGVGVYDPDSPQVKTGVGGPAERVSFGPFSLGWSVSSDGSGWIYYPKMPPNPVTPEDQRMSVTNVDSFEGIDAADPRIIWGAKPFHFDEPAPLKGVVKPKVATPIEIRSIARELTNPKLKDRTPLWRMVTTFDEESTKKLIEAIGESKISELQDFAKFGRPPISRAPAELVLPRGVPIHIEIRTGIAFIQNHPVTTERVLELLEKNRIGKQVSIHIKPSARFATVMTWGERHRPRGSGKFLADTLKEGGYQNVTRSHARPR